MFSESGSINSIKSCSQFKVLVQETVFIILRHFKDKPYVEMSHTIAGLDNISRIDFIIISNLFAVKCSIKTNGSKGGVVVTTITKSLGKNTGVQQNTTIIIIELVVRETMDI